MSSTILFSVLSLGGLAALFAVVLYGVAKKFAVEEDPRVAEVTEMLPGINCGACGFPGCSAMAQGLVNAADEKGDITALYCPPGGKETMDNIAEYFGLEVQEAKPTLAVVRCGGSCDASPAKSSYDGPKSCAVAHSTFSGEGGCPFGCLGHGDCVVACEFDAIYINPETMLPEVVPDKCTSCGACVRACPRNLIEIRPRGRRDRRVWINCRNEEKGAIARKNCSVACIGCGKCVKTCETIKQAITMENNLAYIDPEKCIACGQCVPVCPTGAILATFEPPKPKPKKETANATP
ncbi:MAG: RnfABCDGE type electron transport complex subunit B [Alkalispirochaetaceae bacterium]